MKYYTGVKRNELYKLLTLWKHLNNSVEKMKVTENFGVIL